MMVTINYIYLGLDSPFSIPQISIFELPNHQPAYNTCAESIRHLAINLQFCKMFMYSFVHRVFWDVRVQFGTNRFLWNVGVQFCTQGYSGMCTVWCTEDHPGCNTN